MKTLKGNGADSTFFKGAINPGSNLAIESATLQDVNIYGGTLSIPGGVVLNGRATTSGTAAVAFTGGTIGTGGYVTSSAIIDSAVLGYAPALTASQGIVMVGSGGSMLDMNGLSLSMATTPFSAYNVIFSGGSAVNTGVFRTSNTSAYFSGCTFAGNSVGTIMFYQTGNTARTDFENCTFAENYASTNYCCFMRANNGFTRFVSCTITGNTARSYQVGYTGGGSMAISNCIFTSNILTLNNASLVYTAGTTTHYESCVFSSNYSTLATHNARILLLGGTVSLANCYVEPIISSPAAMNDVFISATCVCSISGGTYSRVQNMGSQTTLAGSLSFDRFVSGTVNIASGTSIALTSNMSCTAIVVADGGCMVNGAVVSAGTYTSIASDGTAT